MLCGAAIDHRHLHQGLIVNAAMPGEARILLRDGMHLVLRLAEPSEPWVPLGTGWSCSVLLGGKPVLLTGWLPGVCLHISTRLQSHTALPGFFKAAWPHAQELALAWQRQENALSPTELPLPYSRAWLARDVAHLPAAALQIDWRTPLLWLC